MAETPLGWTITVQLPDGSAPQVYNVALANEREAIDAVKRVLSGTKDTIIKVKSELVERTFKGLKMKPGDVMLGARRCKQPAQNQAAHHAFKMLSMVVTSSLPSAGLRRKGTLAQASGGSE